MQISRPVPTLVGPTDLFEVVHGFFQQELRGKMPQDEINRRAGWSSQTTAEKVQAFKDSLAVDQRKRAVLRFHLGNSLLGADEER